jgi:hypothetical protein
VLLAEVGDVVGLDPDRQPLQLQLALEGRQGLRALLAAVLALQAVLGQGQLGVALRQLAKAAQVAALGDPDLDRGVALRP